MTDPKPKKMFQRAKREDTIQAELRIQEIVTMILRGASTAQIVKHVKDKWDRERASAHIYIREAKKIIRKQAEIDKQFEVGKAMMRLDDLYLKTYSLQDYARATAIVKQRSELLGLNAPTTQKIAPVQIDAQGNETPYQPTITDFNGIIEAARNAGKPKPD